MIRINLLAESTWDDVPAADAGSPAAFQARILGVCCLAVASLLGAAWWLLGSWRARLDSRMAMEQSQATRMAGVAAENRRYDLEVQDINRRIAAVRSLEANRQGPVAFLVSLQSAANRSPGLYLLSAGPKDGGLALSGAAGSVTAVADLVAALEASDGYRDVRLREYHEDDGKSGQVRYKFSVDCTYQPPAAAGTAPAGATAGPPPASSGEGLQPGAEKHHG